MTTCVVEFTILIPEFPGGCGGKGGMLERGREGEREGEGDLWVGFFWGKKEREKKKKKEKRRDTHINESTSPKSQNVLSIHTPQSDPTNPHDP